MKIIIEKKGIKLDIEISYSNENIEITAAELIKAVDILEQVQFTLRGKIKDLA